MYRARTLAGAARLFRASVGHLIIATCDTISSAVRAAR